MKTKTLLKTLLAAIAPLAAAGTLHAQITWDGNGNPNVGGNWSTAVNWDTNVAPTTGNTAILDVTGANRTITYDAGASGALGTLTINQTSAFLNQLAITRASGLNVANAITLGATGGGTAEIRIGDINNITAATYLTAPSITLNSGGLLNFQVGGNATANTGIPTFNGSLTIAGGTAGPLAAPFAGATSQGTINGNVTMTSGTFRVVDAVNPATVDARMQVQGIFNATGGTLLGGRIGNQLVLGGSSQTHTIGSGVTITGSPTIALLAGNSTLNLDATGAGPVLFRTFISANNTQSNTLKTTSGNGSVSVGRVEFGVANNNARSRAVLGSDVVTTLNTGSQPLTAAFGPGAGNTAEYELDLGGRLFDGTSHANGWTPNIINAATAKWFINSGSAGGVLRVTSVNTSTANVQTSFGNNVTLQITGGSNTVINLSGSGGTFDAGSTVLYTGSAAASTPAIVTTNRTVPNFLIRQGNVRFDNDLGSGSSVSVGDSLTVGGLTAAAGNILSGVALNTPTVNSNFTGWVSGGTNSATAGQGSGRARIQANADTTVTGNIVLAGDGGSGATDVRTEIGAQTSRTLTINGTVTSALGGSNGVIFNGGAIGSGTIRLSNASNNFAGNAITVAQGTLISGVSGALTNGGTIILADGSAQPTGASVALLAEGNQTIGSSLDLSNTSFGVNGNALTDATTLGVNNASTVIFSGGISARAYRSDVTNGPRNLVLTAASGGTATFSGNITQVAAGVGFSNTTTVNKTGAGTVILSGSGNAYTGNTTVSVGTLLVNNTTGSGTGTGALSVALGGATLGGTGIIAPTGTNGLTVNTGSFIAPGANAAIGTLTVALGGTTGTVAMLSGSSFKFELGTANAGIGSIAGGSSDMIALTGASASDFAFNGNNIDFLGTGTGQGFYRLFDTSFGATTWTGLTFNGTTGLVSSGLTASNFTGGTTADFFVGTAANGGNLGDIYLNVVPEPSTWVLIALGLTFVVVTRRRSRNDAHNFN